MAMAQFSSGWGNLLTKTRKRSCWGKTENKVAGHLDGKEGPAPSFTPHPNPAAAQDILNKAWNAYWGRRHIPYRKQNF